MPLRTYQIDPGFDAEMQQLLRQAEPIVERVLGSSADRVDVAWELGTVNFREGEPAARLRLTDAGVSRTREFEVWDIGDEMRFRRRVYLLWDRLLSDRLRLQREAVLQSLAEPTEG